MSRIAGFGTTRAGAPVARVALAAGRLTAGVLTHGAILQDLRLDDRPLTLGSDDLAAYDGGPMRHFGAVIGPVAGRLRDGRAALDGQVLTLPPAPMGHALHSGAAPLHAKAWEIADAGPAHVTLVTRAAPGEGGLPGARRFTATYALDSDGLRLTLTAETDAATLVNLTHHGYWHMGGPPGLDAHRLQIDTGRYLPVDDATLPTGQIAPVAGTRFDLRAPRALPPEPIDNCFCLADAPRARTRAARLEGPDGTALELDTTAPGLQVYTGEGAGTEGFPGHGGTAYPPRGGLALEPQHWPDAPNHPQFPSIRLGPGEAWRSDSLFRVLPAD